MAKKTHKPESKNCFLTPDNHQYITKSMWININKGTAKLKTDNDGKVLGEIYGNANDAKNNNANTLLMKKTILLKKDKFFNGLNFC